MISNAKYPPGPKPLVPCKSVVWCIIQLNLILKIMTNYKQKVFPDNKRIIEACGYFDGKVQAYWKEGIRP